MIEPHIAEKATAILSLDGVHRYALTREWGNGKLMTWIGVNPSTADATLDDATIRKIRGFSKGIPEVKGFAVVNLFSYRATDVKELARALPAVNGPDADEHLLNAINQADYVVACWGPLTKLPRHLRGRYKEVLQMAGRKPIYRLGHTAKDGQPRHPLMLSYTTQLEKHQ